MSDGATAKNFEGCIVRDTVFKGVQKVSMDDGLRNLKVLTNFSFLAYFDIASKASVW